MSPGGILHTTRLHLDRFYPIIITQLVASIWILLKRIRGTNSTIVYHRLVVSFRAFWVVHNCPVRRMQNIRRRWRTIKLWNFSYNCC